MPVVRANPPRARRGRRPAPVADAPYALPYAPYDPMRPAILSIAHDDADGGGLYVVTDRPCVVGGGSAFDLPLLILAAGGGYRLRVLSYQPVAGVPVKLRLQMSGPVPPHAAWGWPPAAVGMSNLVDPVTSQPINAAAGDCADVPGPYVPPAPATVVSASCGSAAGGGEGWATLTFDRPVIVNNLSPDDAILFAGMYAATAVSQSGAETLTFAVPLPLSSGQAWAIDRQPAWVQSPVAWPQGGTF